MKDETASEFVSLRVEGHKEVYYVDLEGRDLLFRPLTFSEYQLVCDLEKHLDGPFINDTIVRLACLYTDFSSLDSIGVESLLLYAKAFLIDKLAECILQISGFQNPDLYLSLVEQKRAEAIQLDGLMQTYACAAFNIEPQEFENYSLERQVKLFAMAEQVIGQEIDVQSIVKGDVEPKQGMQAPPVPPGMESIDFVNDPTIAERPEF